MHIHHVETKKTKRVNTPRAWATQEIVIQPMIKSSKWINSPWFVLVVIVCLFPRSLDLFVSVRLWLPVFSPSWVMSLHKSCKGQSWSEQQQQTYTHSRSGGIKITMLYSIPCLSFADAALCHSIWVFVLEQPWSHQSSPSILDWFDHSVSGERIRKSKHGQVDDLCGRFI